MSLLPEGPNPFRPENRIPQLPEPAREGTTPETDGHLYARRDIEDLCEYYTRHLDAMTREGLHSKSDIAAELGWRDREITRALESAAERATRARDLRAELHAALQRAEAAERRAAKLEKEMQFIAIQKLPSELDEPEDADYQGGYEAIVNGAREALAPTNEPKV